MSEAPSCTLSRDALDARREGALNELFSKARGFEARSDGYRALFPDSPAIRDEIEAFRSFESDCCSFMKIAIRPRADGLIAVDMTGPEGTREFLARHAPSSVARASETAPGRRAIWAVAASSAAALVCCATPMLGIALGAAGLAHHTGNVAAAIDIAAPAGLLAAGTALAVSRFRARKGPENTGDCGC